jgi:hypothetical protein
LNLDLERWTVAHKNIVFLFSHNSYFSLNILMLNLLNQYFKFFQLHYLFNWWMDIKNIRSRGVQIRSEINPNPIRLDFGTKIFISDWIGLIKLFHSRIGLRYSKSNDLIIHDNAVVAVLFVWYFNWTSLCQLLDMYFLLLYLFG